MPVTSEVVVYCLDAAYYYYAFGLFYLLVRERRRLFFDAFGTTNGTFRHCLLDFLDETLVPLGLCLRGCGSGWLFTTRENGNVLADCWWRRGFPAVAGPWLVLNVPGRLPASSGGLTCLYLCGSLFSVSSLAG
jgi:hypothetical protein